MSHLMRPARPEEGIRILEILESSPAKGSIELLYTRRPDAYRSYQKESPEVHVFSVEDEGKIIATAAEIVHDMYIGGLPRKTGYLCGLKKDIAYLENIHWGRAFFRNIVKDHIDCYYCSVVDDNKRMNTVLERKRKRTVNNRFLQKYTTYMLAPYFHFKVDDGGCEFRRARPEDEAKLLEFFRAEGQKKEFFPVIASLNQFAHLSAEDFYFLQKDGEIVAAGALWNQSPYRQYLVKKYRGVLKFARFFNPLLKALGYIPLPKENETLSFPMLSFFLAEGDSEIYYKSFLNHIIPEIRKNYTMFVIGTAESYFANNIYKKLRNIHFDTRIYSVDFAFVKGKTLPINPRALWLECGLL